MPRCDALDWLKASGICLIVYGHVAHATTVSWVPPIYVKQFGVAFFLFATGFALARERRAPLGALITRLTPVYLFGLTTAISITVIGMLFGTGLQPSNYLPFLAGANVVFNNFPANPTTWYLGTYIHALLLWALVLSRRQPGPAMIGLALAIEIPARIALQQLGGPFVAYMVITNWLAVFIAGLVIGARPRRPVTKYRVAYLGALGMFLAAVSLTVGAMNPEPAFPFMQIGAGSPRDLAMFSMLVSGLYLSTTLLTFEALEHAVAPAVVRFLARNSLIIVLLHMPLFMALNPVLIASGWPYGARVVVHLVICLPLLAWFSEAVTRVVQPKALARQLAELTTVGDIRILTRRLSLRPR